MKKRHHYRRTKAQPTELDMTTFLNLMVVLVPFLLITAVFSRITIVELSLPTSSGGAAPVEPEFRIEVIVRESGLELADAKNTIAALPMVNGAYDLDTLGDMVIELKRSHPDSNDASVLLEPDIEYDHLIQVMDVVRSAPMETVLSDEPAEEPVDPNEVQRVALFTNISIGDAP